MKKYRNEWKYICSNTSLAMIRNRLDALMHKDIHTNFNGIYNVHNIYFDDYKNNSAKSVEAGNLKRFKWRIRYYNDDIDTIKLERKEKLYGRCHKLSTPLTFNEYNALINGNVEDILWETDKELVKKLCIDIMTKRYVPKIIVDYEREAYVDEILNIRITFDKNISASYEIDKFLRGDYIKVPLQELPYNVLEVKFDDILPGYIKKIIESVASSQTAFSKYYTGRKMMEMIK